MHPAVTLVIHPDLVGPLYSGVKQACMVQGNFVPGQPIRFETVQGQSTVKIASAVIYAIAGLRITPAIEQIEHRKNYNWELLPAENVLRVLKAEGFNKPDDFWKWAMQADAGKPFEVNQIYFDELKRAYT